MQIFKVFVTFLDTFSTKNRWIFLLLKVLNKDVVIVYYMYDIHSK